MDKKLPAYNVYLIYSGAVSLFFALTFTVSSVYCIEIVKLNPLQLVLVGTVLESACFLFEIPTGVVADIYSRRLSIIIGIILIGAGFLLEGTVPFFAAVIGAQVIWGIGSTFLSGADDAWIADEIGERNLEKVYLKGTQVSQFCSLAGIFVSTALSGISVMLPIILSGALFIVFSLFLVFYMPETGFKPAAVEDRNTWENMQHTFISGIHAIRKRYILMTALAVSLFYGLYSEGFDRLWTAHFITDFKFPSVFHFKPSVWIGLINASAVILSIIVVELVKRRLDKSGKLDRAGVLIFTNALLTGGIIAFGLAGNFAAALAAYWASYIFRSTNSPIYYAWINKNLESGVRATVISTIGQVDSLGQIIGGPVIGLIAEKFSISTAILSAGIILSPCLLLYMFAAAKKRREKIGTCQ